MKKPKKKKPVEKTKPEKVEETRLPELETTLESQVPAPLTREEEKRRIEELVREEELIEKEEVKEETEITEVTSEELAISAGKSMLTCFAACDIEPIFRIREILREPSLL